MALEAAEGRILERDFGAGEVDELTMRSLGLGILCNFPPHCGEERAKEAYNIFLSMKNEIMRYRSMKEAKP